jgi:hypothetical protein
MDLNIAASMQIAEYYLGQLFLWDTKQEQF